jgi:hypothetical protein
VELSLTTSLDWTTTREVITSIVSILGLSLAWRGYHTWRRQILGKTQHDAARNVLLAALRTREEIRHVRHAAAIVPSPDEFEKLGDADDNEQLWRKRLREDFSGRLERLQGRVVELRLAELEGEALWGTEAKGRVEPLTQLAQQVNNAVWEYFWIHGLSVLPAIAKNPDHVRKVWGIVAAPSSREGGEAKDAFGENVDAAVSELENYYRPKLQLKGR